MKQYGFIVFHQEMVKLQVTRFGEDRMRYVPGAISVVTAIMFSLSTLRFGQ
jgi:hypothetical protein